MCKEDTTKKNLSSKKYEREYYKIYKEHTTKNESKMLEALA
jgi:hypothetical protein